MKIYNCPACSGPLYFSNMQCACGMNVAFDPAQDAFTKANQPCANRQIIQCNWVAAGDPGTLCHSCAMTEIIPDLSQPDNQLLWENAERAKRWVIHNLSQWGWLSPSDPGRRPRFHLLSEQTSRGETDVTMGHADGLITINVMEADAAISVARREQLSERYRTMIGHFRHEIGHHIFFRLLPNKNFSSSFRALMGDERADYGAALSKHYQDGPAADWGKRHVTAYASAHPHEDWAESFAHLVHLTDMIDSFSAAGLQSSEKPKKFRAYGARKPEKLISVGVSLGIALNHVNRSMGLFDIYPFVLSATAREKLAFVHDWVAAGPFEKP